MLRRYLSVTEDVRKDKMQLIGVTALFLAAKLEEVNPPIVSDYAKVTAGAHSSAEIMQMELILLDVRLGARAPPPPLRPFGPDVPFRNCTGACRR